MTPPPAARFPACENPPMITRGRAAFAFIFVTVLLDMLAFGIIAPVLPQLIVRVHAVPGVAGARRARRPVRPPPRRPPVEPRPRCRLRRHGPRADDPGPLHRPAHLGRH